MQGAVLYEIDKPLVLEELKIPDLAHGQVLVRIKCSGVCHSQLKEITGARGEDRYLPHLLGHEGAGIVEEVGPGVTRVVPGDHVVLGWMKGQGIDSSTPTYHIGEKPINAGYITTFNEFGVVSENRVTRMRDEMPFDVASLLGCAVTTGLGAVDRIAEVRAGESVAVFGVGGVGLNVVQGAAIAGASQIIAIDLKDEKLELAGRLGATHHINASRENPLEKVMEVTDGVGVNHAFEVTGETSVMSQAFEATSMMGKAVLMGVPKAGNQLSLDPVPLCFGKTITGCHGGNTVKDEDIPRFVDLYLDGRLKLDELITDRIKLSEINEAFDRMREGKILGKAIVEFD
jgi:S-(hydroxymethyl)glutathione dehydrogenase / alcohol dehydrogenase